MRKIILMMSVFVDGYMEGVGRDLTWQSVDEGLYSHFNAELATMGRSSTGGSRTS